MAQTLALLRALEGAANRNELTETFLDLAPAALDVFGVALVRFAPTGAVSDVFARGIPTEYEEAYRRFSPTTDPILARAIDERRPVHDRDGLSDPPACPAGNVGQSTLHYLATPLLGARGVLGSINLTRSPHPFTSHDVTNAWRVSGQLSASLSHFGPVERDRSRCLPRRDLILSQRELEITRLVADGASNGNVAAILAVSESYVKKVLVRAFRKLGVATRVELALRFAQSR